VKHLATMRTGQQALVFLAAGLAASSPPAMAQGSPGEILAASGAEEWRSPEPDNTLYMELADGRVVIELAPDFAPRHVARIKALARQGFYDGLDFYRVVDGFVAQAGAGEEGRDTGELDPTIAAEFERTLDPALSFTPLGATDGYAAEVGFVAGFPAARDPAAGRMWLVHCPQAVAMARDNEPDSGGTEIYVVIGHAPRYLDRNLTIFGRVVAGQELLQRLPRGEAGSGMIAAGAPRGTIQHLRVAGDLPADERSSLEVLRTDSPSFVALIAARRNRPEAFFVYRPDHIDVCGVPIPVRSATTP
jgi:cyclophilin family peptidyl-prolyl cis-trans isomerase